MSKTKRPAPPEALPPIVMDDEVRAQEEARKLEAFLQETGLAPFFENVLPGLPEDAGFYQPASWEHYASAVLQLPDGVTECNGWVFTIQDQKLLWAQKLPESATNELTE